MKKLFILLLLVIAMCLPIIAYAHETPEVCGNSYTFVYDEIMFLVKFTSSNPELPCTTGTVALFWLGKKQTHSFTVKNDHFILVPGLGKFAALEDQLYLLDSSTIVFDIF